MGSKPLDFYVDWFLGKREKRDILGILTRLVGESFCIAVGFIVRPFVEKRFGHWLEIYDPDIY